MRDDERAALEEIHRRRAEGAEVVCVIRSHSDPQSPSEILVLDHVSPEFLRELAAEANSPTLQQRLPRPAETQATSGRLPEASDTAGGDPSYSMPAAPLRPISEPRWLDPAQTGR